MERRKFSREFKLEAVKLVRERGVSMAQAARDLDLQALPRREPLHLVEASVVAELAVARQRSPDAFLVDLARRKLIGPVDEGSDRAIASADAPDVVLGGGSTGDRL